MIEAHTSQTIVVAFDWGTPALVGTLGARLTRPNASIVQARSTAGIVEAAPGVYEVTRTMPAEVGTFLLYVDDGTDHAVEEVAVFAPAAPSVPAPPLEAAEQAELALGVLELLPQAGEIRRKAAGATWATVAAAAPCLVTVTASGGSAVRDAPGGAERSGNARIDVEAATDLRAGDRVLVWAQGVRFEVELVAPPGFTLRTGYGRLEAI